MKELWAKQNLYFYYKANTRLFCHREPINGNLGQITIEEKLHCTKIAESRFCLLCHSRNDD